MGLKINFLSDMSAIILEAIQPMCVPDDARTILSAVDEFKSLHPGHLYQIYDMTGIDLLCSDMIIATAAETVYDFGELDRAITTILIGERTAIDFSRDYIPTETILFDSQDEALDFVCSQA